MTALPRLQTLFDRTSGAAIPLPEALREAYGGDLRFEQGASVHLVANFVSTVDGIVSYGTPGAESARHISRGHAGDRFVMGLLRAAADAVVAGAGTLRVEPKVTFTPRQIFPPAADLYADLRRARGLAERTRVAVLTASGEIDPSHPVLRSADVEPLIVTSDAGAARLAAMGASGPRVIAVGDTTPTMRDAVEAVASTFGARLILSEAGPTLFGQMLRDRVVDELFLTLAPRLAGRSPERRGMALVEGAAFAPEDAPEAELVSARRSDGYLLLRYGFKR